MRLEIRNLSKSFPGVQALSEISLQLESGKVHALLGENGAGKSTLLKIITGVYSDYDGELLLDDKFVSFREVREAQQAGITIIHQELNLIPQLNIVENLFLGRELKTGVNLPDNRKMLRQAQEVLSRLRLNIDPRTRISQLKVGQQQLVEIARALLSDAKLILMDEPTSALSDLEIANLHQIINELRNEGRTIVYISHKMDELFRIAEVFHVLRDGKHIGSGNLKEQTPNELIRMMVGREITTDAKTVGKSERDPVLKVSGLSLNQSKSASKQILKNLSFSLGRGEILGIFGLMGAGRTELLETLFGLHPERSEYAMTLEGVSCKPKSPRAAIALGLGFLTEDRKLEGLVLGMDIASNIGLSDNRDKLLISSKKEREHAKTYIRNLNIKTPSETQLCRNLSGGNQQKVVLAKWLSTQPKVLLMDEPTRGIDIRAKDEIYSLMRQLAHDGMSVILVSSEIPELRTVADRILVLSDGQFSGNFDPITVSDETLLAAALPSFQPNTVTP